MVGSQPEPLDDVDLGRFRERDDGGPAVERRSQAVFDAIAERSQPRWEDHLPHLGMHVMQKHHSGPATPQRREERHAIPDLDQAITGADLGAHASERGPGEDGVTAGPTVDRVAVTGYLSSRAIDA